MEADGQYLKYDYLVTSDGHTAYAGAGPGIAGRKTEFETTVSVHDPALAQSQYDSSGTTFGYQFGGGFSYRLTERVDLEVIVALCRAASPFLDVRRAATLQILR